MNTPKWSETLKAQTREVLEECRPNPITGAIHVKSSSGSFGRIEINHALKNDFLIVDENSCQLARFETVEALIDGDWVID